ncbi:hypothetical protein DHODJN_25950 [Methylorubrum extorquens]
MSEQVATAFCSSNRANKCLQYCCYYKLIKGNQRLADWF